MERGKNLVIINMVAVIMIGLGMLFHYDWSWSLGLGLIIGSNVMWK